MSEKRFYHLALEGSLLSGKAQKRKLNAKLNREFPERAAKAGKPGNSKEWNPHPVPWIAIPVAAMLLLSTLTVGVMAGANALRGANKQPETVEEPINAASDLNLVDLGCTVKLLPEFDEALKAECLDWRERQHGKPYEEADWAWLRDLKTETVGVAEKDGSFYWAEKISLPRTEPFENEGLESGYDEQALELAVPELLRISAGGEEKQLNCVVNAESYGYRSFSRTGKWESGTYYTASPLPASGTVTVTERIYVVDYKIEDMQRYFGAVAYIDHTFSFNAAAVQAQMPHVVECLYADENMDILIDADVELRAKAPFVTCPAAHRTVTDPMLQAFARYFAGDATLYDDLVSCTPIKSDILQQIAALKDAQAEVPSERDDGSLLKEIESLEKLYETALDSYEQRPVVAPEFVNYHGDPMFQAVYQKDGQWNGISASGSQNGGYLQTSVVRKDDSSRVYSDSPENPAPQPLLTEQEAIAKANEAVQAIAPSLQLDSIRLYGNSDATRSAYVLLYRPVVDGQTIAVRDIAVETEENSKLTGEEFHIDQLNICVDEQGIVSFSWFHPADLGETASANVGYPTADTLYRTVRDALQRKYAEAGKDSTVHVDRIALEYACIEREENGKPTYRIVPVWNFYGNVTNHALEQEGLLAERYGYRTDLALISISAIDGTEVLY